MAHVHHEMIITASLMTIHHLISLENYGNKKKILFSDENSSDLFSYQLAYIIYTSVSCIYHFLCYIPRTYLSYNWKFVPLDHLHPSPFTSGNHKSDLFLYACLFVKYSWPTAMLVPGTQHSDSILLYILKLTPL